MIEPTVVRQPGRVDVFLNLPQQASPPPRSKATISPPAATATKAQIDTLRGTIDALFDFVERLTMLTQPRGHPLHHPEHLALIADIRALMERRTR